ncbi:Hypothetical protein RAK1035_0228 [Roseovarius sp. AK1035]|nr:Hypothetical protein RAK1035_0228 [Roseovarius sp. AK1035]
MTRGRRCQGSVGVINRSICKVQLVGGRCRGWSPFADYLKLKLIPLSDDRLLNRFHELFLLVKREPSLFT